MDLSLRTYLRGWRGVYLHDVKCPNELPSTLASYKTQQFRCAACSPCSPCSPCRLLLLLPLLAAAVVYPHTLPPAPLRPAHPPAPAPAPTPAPPRPPPPRRWLSGPMQIVRKSMVNIFKSRDISFIDKLNCYWFFARYSLFAIVTFAALLAPPIVLWLDPWVWSWYTIWFVVSANIAAVVYLYFTWFSYIYMLFAVVLGYFKAWAMFSGIAGLKKSKSWKVRCCLLALAGCWNAAAAGMKAAGGLDGCCLVACCRLAAGGLVQRWLRSTMPPRRCAAHAVPGLILRPAAAGAAAPQVTLKFACNNNLQLFRNYHKPYSLEFVLGLYYLVMVRRSPACMQPLHACWQPDVQPPAGSAPAGLLAAPGPCTLAAPGMHRRLPRPATLAPSACLTPRAAPARTPPCRWASRSTTPAGSSRATAASWPSASSLSALATTSCRLAVCRRRQLWRLLPVD
jgi:hypothetical protein